MLCNMHTLRMCFNVIIKFRFMNKIHTAKTAIIRLSGSLQIVAIHMTGKRMLGSEAGVTLVSYKLQNILTQN